MRNIFSSRNSMMDLSSNQSRECRKEHEEEGSSQLDFKSNCRPKDLSIKANKKRIPPPLNLISETNADSPVGISTALKEFAILATGPQSPLMQKNLPFRKRAHSVPDTVDHAPLSAPPTVVTSFQIPLKLEKVQVGDGDSNPPLNLSLPATPKILCANNDDNSTWSSHTDNTSQMHSATQHPVSPRHLVSEHHGHSTPHQAFLRHHSQSWSPFLAAPSVMPPYWMNGASSALLSPAPSSLGSSQEDLGFPHIAAHPMPAVPSVLSHSAYEVERWRLPWPHPIWHCFQFGTVIRFLLSGSELAVRAEDIICNSELKNISPEKIGSLYVNCIELVDGSPGAVEIKFSSVHQGMTNDAQLVATCLLHHTFFVLEKGWCAVSPDAVYHHYGMHCPPLECGDCCPVPPKLTPVSSPGICDKFKRFSFSPEELTSPPQPTGSGPTSGFYILSPPNTPTQKNHLSHYQQQAAMYPVKQQKGSKHKSSAHQQSIQKTSQKTPGSKAPLDPDRPKRPMNAFMLFAKQHRLKLIQMHPGKDNRFVSVILGEAWRQLPADQKEVFISEARALSHERKRLHPECWKRKRSQSTS